MNAMTLAEREIYQSRQCDLASHIGHAKQCLSWVDSLNRDGIKIPYGDKLTLQNIVELAQEIIERNPLEGTSE